MAPLYENPNALTGPMHAALVDLIKRVKKLEEEIQTLKENKKQEQSHQTGSSFVLKV